MSKFKTPSKEMVVGSKRHQEKKKVSMSSTTTCANNKGMISQANTIFKSNSQLCNLMPQTTCLRKKT